MRTHHGSIHLRVKSLALAGSLMLSACSFDRFVPPPPARGASPDFTPGTTALRRLTRSQYLASLRAVFGDDITLPAPSQLEPDQRVGTATAGPLVALGTTTSSLSFRGVEQAADAAYLVATQAMAPERSARLVTCTATRIDDEACATATLRRIGEALYRRPLTADELSEAVAISLEAARTLAPTGGRFEDGLVFGIALFLQSPSFLYREELGQGTSATADMLAYSGDEIATRMAFFLWDAPPDEALRGAAQRGELDTPEGIRAAAIRLLDDPRAHDGVRAFVEDWLSLARLDDLVLDPTVHVHASSDLGPAAREESVRLFQHLALETDSDVRDFLTTRTTFVDRRLASIYNVRAPREPFGEVTLPEGRQGYFGHVSFLSANAHPISTSPTLRGLFVRQRFLCEEVPPPPVGVSTAVPEPSTTARTLRERLVAHQAVPYCASCHALVDDIGFTFETFDAAGRARTVENGAQIDTHGHVDGTPIRDSASLATFLHDDPRLANCIVRHAFRVALGRAETEGERSVVHSVTQALHRDDYRFRTLLLAIVTSDAFRFAESAEGQPEMMEMAP